MLAAKTARIQGQIVAICSLGEYFMITNWYDTRVGCSIQCFLTRLQSTCSYSNYQSVAAILNNFSYNFMGDKIIMNHNFTMNGKFLFPKVLILMGTYNGENYLRQQLDSIFNQTYSNIEVLVRDDGSSDETLLLLDQYAKQYPIKIIKGDNKGAFENFCELIKIAPPCDLYAYCDQDDVWTENKIEKAVQAINNIEGGELPVLYIHSEFLTDKDLHPYKQTDVNSEGCANSLSLGIVRNICQGSACVFNHYLMNKLKKIPKNITYMHDWWTYLVCLSYGGLVLTDSTPLIFYRQHDANVVGASKSICNRTISRLKAICLRSGHERSENCKKILEVYGNSLMPTQRGVLLKVSQYRMSIWNTFSLLFDMSFYKGSTRWYKFTFAMSVITRTL